MSSEMIRKWCGERPIELSVGARFTDDTQMTFFTLEGLIRARVRQRSQGTVDTPSVVHQAYLRFPYPR